MRQGQSPRSLGNQPPSPGGKVEVSSVPYTATQSAVTNHRHRPPIFILSDVSINQSDCNNVQLFSDQVV